MIVVEEGGYTLQHNLNMIVDGHTCIEHAIPVARGYDDIEQLWSGTQVGYTLRPASNRAGRCGPRRDADGQGCVNWGKCRG